MPSTAIDRDALLEVTIGNLALMVDGQRISSLLAGPIALAMVQADDAGDLARMRWIAKEVERVRQMFVGLATAKVLTPEAGTMGRMFAIATLRSIVTPLEAD